jgi:hypothetical protein
MHVRKGPGVVIQYEVMMMSGLVWEGGGAEVRVLF